MAATAAASTDDDHIHELERQIKDLQKILNDYQLLINAAAIGGEFLNQAWEKLSEKERERLYKNDVFSYLEHLQQFKVDNTSERDKIQNQINALEAKIQSLSKKRDLDKTETNGNMVKRRRLENSKSDNDGDTTELLSSKTETLLSLIGKTNLDVGVVRLPLPLWGNMKRDQHDLLIRDCYIQLNKYVVDFLEDNSKKNAFLITGSKGIGKSCCIYSLIPHLCETSTKAICYQGNNVRILLIPKSCEKNTLDMVNEKVHRIGLKCELNYVYEFDITDINVKGAFEALSYNQGILLITDIGDDSKILPDLETASSMQIIITSPNAEKIHRIGEMIDLATFFTVPEWSREECMNILPKLDAFSTIPNNEIEKEFDLIGGKPRYLLHSYAALNDKVKDAVSKISFDTLKAILQSSYSNVPKFDDVAGLLVKVTPNVKIPSNPRRDLASNDIKWRLYERIRQEERNKLNEFLRILPGTNHFATFRGQILESAMHNVLSAMTGSNEIISESLTLSGMSSKIEIKDWRRGKPRMKRLDFYRQDMSDLEDRKFEQYDYAYPQISNFEALDAIAIMDLSDFHPKKKGPCVVGFQATVSKDHPVSRQKLMDVQAVISKCYHSSQIQNTATSSSAEDNVPLLPFILVFVTTPSGVHQVQKYLTSAGDGELKTTNQFSRNTPQFSLTGFGDTLEQLKPLMEEYNKKLAANANSKE